MIRRKHPTIADLAAMALCPSLIVLLISSLVYFLTMCVYRGGYSGRIGYIWFMFIMGAVGIARISIEESRKYAMGYAAALGLATFVVLSRFITIEGPLAATAPIFNGMVIALVWFLADRITFDCTLIDEDEDASGRGLLDGLTDEATPQNDAAQQRSRKRGHQPGRTVMWLTAAALPIFGLGQAMLPADERWQRSAMLVLGIYLFAALSLMIATSFLGVRRYLRQRGVDMPTNVSTAWLAGGLAMTLLLLLLCFLLPQPGKMIATAELPQSLDSPDWLKPSKYGWGNETASNQGESGDSTSAAAAKPPADSDTSPDGNQKSGDPNVEGKGTGGQGKPPADQPHSQNPASGEADASAQTNQSSNEQEQGQSPGQGKNKNSADDSGGQTKGESSQGESAKGESAKGESAKGESAKGESAKSESAKGESAKGESAKGESAKGESAKGESAKGDESAKSSTGAEEDQQGNPPTQNAAPEQESSDDQSSGDQASSDKKSQEKSENGESGSSDEQNADKKPSPDENADKQDEPDEAGSQSAESTPPETPDASPSMFDSLPSITTLLRGLIYLVAIGVLAAFLWFQRHEIAKAWQAFLAWLRGEAPSVRDDTLAAMQSIEAVPSRPFASFRNPLNKNVEPREAIIVTYQAAEAWWRERGHPRMADETPQEYSRRLKPRDPTEHEALLRLTDAYNRIVYGDQSVQSPDLVAAADVWKSFAKR